MNITNVMSENVISKITNIPVINEGA